MKIRSTLVGAAILGLLLGTSHWILPAMGQQDPDAATVPFGNFNPFATGTVPQVRMPTQGTWAEVINVTSRWMVVQNEQGQQFPIASDRVRQFMIRWPYLPSQITNQSMLEVIGNDDGSNVIITDHIDVFENDAQGLVSPTVTNLYGNFNTLNYGNFQTLSSYGIAEQDPFGMGAFIANQNGGNASRKHVVGHALANDPIQIAGFGMNWFTVQGSQSGMSITQVTVGSNTYAKRGDVVYIVPENQSPRSLDVSQLVLYKKIPLRAFQP